MLVYGVNIFAIFINTIVIRLFVYKLRYNIWKTLSGLPKCCSMLLENSKMSSKYTKVQSDDEPLLICKTDEGNLQIRDSLVWIKFVLIVLNVLFDEN